MSTHDSRVAPGIARSGRAEKSIAAPVGDVWAVVSDVTRNGEWSGECYSVSWLDPAAIARTGARFRGRNRSGRMRWSRVCELVTLDPPHELAWHTTGILRRLDSTEWRITLEPTNEGTRVRQTYRVLRLARWLDRLYTKLNPSHIDRTGELATDLDRLAGIIEAAMRRPAPPATDADPPVVPMNP